MRTAQSLLCDWMGWRQFGSLLKSRKNTTDSTQQTEGQLLMLMLTDKVRSKTMCMAGVSILTSYGENPHYVKLPIFSEFMENSTKFMKNSDLTKWTQNLR